LFNKQYNGKLDRVALYQLNKSYWDKKPLKKEQNKKINKPEDLLKAEVK